MAIGLGINLNAYAILPGTYTIGGTSPNYTTLSAAINALNATGVQGGDVIFNIRSGTYTSTSWRGEIEPVQNASASARVIFQSESGNPADVVINVPGTSSDNYIVRLKNASYVTFRNLTFTNTNTSYGRIFDFTSSASYDSIVNCRLNGATSTSSGDICAIIYAYSHLGTTNVFYKNVFTNGSSWAYMRGTSTSAHSKDIRFIENTFNMTNSGYYGMYNYYTADVKFLNNVFNYNGTSTFYGFYSYYSDYNFEFTDNKLNFTSTSTLYDMYFYYISYAALNGGHNGSYPKMSRNVINTTNTSGTTYLGYVLYASYLDARDNIINGKSATGTIYMYGYNYGAKESMLEDNVINITVSSTGTLYAYIDYDGSNYGDTTQNNVYNLATNGTLYNYVAYYGKSIIRDNVINMTNTTGTTYNYLSNYASGARVYNNKFKIVSTTGSIYGAYLYTGSTSYSGTKSYNNDIEMVSTGAASHWGIYGSYVNGEKIYNNVITSKSAGGTCYLARFVGTQYSNSSIFNNTFHHSGTASTVYGLYTDGGSINFVNNILSNSNAPATGNAAYIKGSDFKSDYNLYSMSVPTSTMFVGPTYTGASLDKYRADAKTDFNSLVYSAPFTDAGNRDFTINAASPAAWAVNGRGVHDSTRYTDRSGAAVPLFVTSGVPDIGAYEVEPTSTPPDAVATPANPVANAFQVFTFGQDTVLAIEWGATVPTTYTVKQYTGEKATPVPAGLKRMFFNIQGDASSLDHSYTAYTFYKDPWIGDIPTENDAVLARQSGTGGWVGYNYTNALRETTRNIVSTVGTIDSAGSFTVVENGRIGIRCVYPPTGIRISNITAESADIKWDAIYNPLGYQVIVKKNSTPPTDTEWGAALNPTSNSVTSGNLDEDTKYYVFVRNICGAKDTSGYTIDSFTTIITCHAPTITVVDVHNTRAVVYWDSVRTAYGYEVALTTSSTAPANGTNITSAERLFSFLDPGKTYYAHVRANCNTMYAKSEWTTVEFSTWATGVEQINNTGAGMEIYPNPVREELVVTLGGKVTSGTVTVQDMTGKTLKAVQVTENKVHVNVQELPAGVYILQYAEDGRREQVKFTKQ